MLDKAVKYLEATQQILVAQAQHEDYPMKRKLILIANQLRICKETINELRTGQTPGT